MPKAASSTVEMLAHAADLQDKNQKAVGASADLRARSIALRERVRSLKSRTRKVRLGDESTVFEPDE